jgi:hypothetical protein
MPRESRNKSKATPGTRRVVRVRRLGYRDDGVEVPRRRGLVQRAPPDTLASVLHAEIENEWFDMSILAEDRQREEQTRRRIMRALPGGAA